MSFKVDGCVVVVGIELIISQLKACLFQTLNFIKIHKFSCFTGPRYGGLGGCWRVRRRQFRESRGREYTGAKGIDDG